MTEKKAPPGASLADWNHFDLVLGLGSDLLPVVPDEGATPSAGSKIKKFGKIPSVYDGEGNAHGLKDWQTREITSADLTRWSADRRLSMCVRCSAVRAIDVDVTDERFANRISDYIFMSGQQWGEFEAAPRRTRANSPKFLIAFRLEGKHKKRIINTEHGRIEFLADGQQFVAAGSHPSGALYEWHRGRPDDIPSFTLEQFERVWTGLAELFGAAPAADRTGNHASEAELGEALRGEPSTLTEIDSESLARLGEALSFAPLLKAAADNDFWSEIGYALLSLGPSVGYGLWEKFSIAAPEHEPGAEDEWWKAHQSQEPRSDYRHVFTLARKLGWGKQADIDSFPIADVPTGTINACDLVASPPDRPTIRIVEGRLHEYARAAEQILSPHIYTQGDRLIRLGDGGELEDGVRRDEAQATMVRVSDHYVLRKLTELVQFEKWDARAQDWVPKDCPDKLAGNITHQYQWPTLRPLAAIARSPFLRRGGTICDRSGYDAESAVVLVPAGEFEPVGVDGCDKPAALQALHRLLEPFGEFPFATGSARSAFAAHILTEAARVAICTSPMFFYTAPNAGTGKTLLSAMPALVVHGNEPSVRPWVKDGDEVRKSLFASLLGGDRSIAFDNIPTGDKMRSAELCRFLTARDTYKDRRLGESEVVSVRNTAVVSASGNNINPAGDLSRRSIIVRLDANTNALRARRFHIADLHAHVLAYRDKLLPAALTIMRAYVLSGVEGPVPLPSFEEWSRLCRDPLLWLGMADPLQTQEDEAEHEEIGGVSEAFKLLVESTPIGLNRFAAKDVANACFQLSDMEGGLAATLVTAGCSEPSNSAKVGYWLRHNRDQIAGDYKLERGTMVDGTQRWRFRGVGSNKDLI